MVVVGIGVVGGVIEVKFHPDQLAALPGRLTRIVQDKAWFDRGLILGINLKRKAEFWLIRDEDQRLELAIDYVEKDAERVDKLLEEKQPLDAIVPSAEMLMMSVERAGEAIIAARADSLADWQEETKVAFAAAGATAQRLKEAHADYQALGEKFAAAVTKLEEHVGSLAREKSSGDVAGTKDAPDATPASTIPAIQLNF